MKKILFASILTAGLAIAFGFGLMPKSEQEVCADGVCGREVMNIAESLLKNWASECAKVADGKTGTEASKVCLLAQKYQAIAPKLKQLANNGPFTLGPRDLEVGTSQNGTIINPAVRTFLTPTLMDKDSLTVEVEKKGGRAGANIYICKITEDKKYIHLKTLTFEDGSGTSKQTATVTGVKQHLVQVFIDGVGGPPKAFDYTLKTSAN